MKPTPCHTLLHRCTQLLALTSALCGLAATPAIAGPFSFSTGNPDGLIATAARPTSGIKPEIETADDFILTSQTQISHATFTGLLTGGATLADINQVVTQIYNVFPLNSTNPPSGNVPTRTNSPADVALDSRDSALGTLSFSVSVLNNSFTAGNSVLNGINPAPGQTTGGEGAVTGIEVLFDVLFATPYDLLADHYFFVPQVGLNNGDFMWLSASRPISGGTGPFSPDLQTWIRDADLAPDWLRVGTDIIGPGNAYNAAFTLDGQTVTRQTVPEPGTLVLCATGLALLARRWGGCRMRA